MDNRLSKTLDSLVLFSYIAEGPRCEQRIFDQPGCASWRICYHCL